MTKQKQIRMNALDQCTPSFLAFGLWAHERDRALDYTKLDYWLEYARLLERGKFDAIFLADILGVPDVYEGSSDAAFRTGALAPSIDPASIVSAMATVTENLGFAITGSASYEVPYMFARRSATLDHLTNGRLGWNIVTGFLNSGARAVGQQTLVGHDQRYDEDDKFVDVVLSLLGESWGKGVLLRDKATGQFADPSKILMVDRLPDPCSQSTLQGRPNLRPSGCRCCSRPEHPSAAASSPPLMPRASLSTIRKWKASAVRSLTSGHAPKPTVVTRKA